MKMIKKLLKFEIKDAYMKLAGGIFTVLVAAIAYMTTTGSTKTYSTSSIGPVTIPRIVCGAIFTLGIVQIIQWCIVRGKAPKEKVEKTRENEEPVDKIFVFRKITPVVSFLLLALYIFLMGKVGFVIASVAYLTLQIPLLSVDLSPKSFLKSLILGVIVSALIFLLFAKGFQLRLPTGPWGF